jgi:hypothetical protein
MIKEDSNISRQNKLTISGTKSTIEIQKGTVKPHSWNVLDIGQKNCKKNLKAYPYLCFFVFIFSVYKR